MRSESRGIEPEPLWHVAVVVVAGVVAVAFGASSFHLQASMNGRFSSIYECTLRKMSTGGIASQNWGGRWGGVLSVFESIRLDGFGACEWKGEEAITHFRPLRCSSSPEPKCGTS